MRIKYIVFLIGMLFFQSCHELEEEYSYFHLERAFVGDEEISLDGDILNNVPLDRPIQLEFSSSVSSNTIKGNIFLQKEGEELPYSFNLFSNQTLLSINPASPLQEGKSYQIIIDEGLSSKSGQRIEKYTLNFKTGAGPLTINQIEFIDSKVLLNGRITDVPLSPEIQIHFSGPVTITSLKEAVEIEDFSGTEWEIIKEEDNLFRLYFNDKLEHYKKYSFVINENLEGKEGAEFSSISFPFYTGASLEPVMPEIDDESLLQLVQESTFKYFWDFAHENSGMARERNTSGNLVTTGGSGFGVISMIVGVERGFINRDEAVQRWKKIIGFLENADRFHGAWPHWLNGNTGKTIPFSALDDGGDLVETALLLQGLLTVRAYLSAFDSEENDLRKRIIKMYEEVEWDWYTRGENVLYWHWSENVGWAMNLPIQGYNESLITYILAAASPTHPIPLTVYTMGWSRNGAMLNGRDYYGITLPLGKELGGPLFFTHYSFLSIDPRTLSDQFADYWKQNTNHSLINYAYVKDNPRGFVGYSSQNWGLTASDNQNGYSAHSPLNDQGVITPTAAISSIPYTPEESMTALKFFYYQLGDRLWGEYGFYDAFNLTEEWFAESYLAIDQGPIIIMIENYRSGLLWDLMHQNETFQNGLDRLNFKY